MKFFEPKPTGWIGTFMFLAAFTAVGVPGLIIDEIRKLNTNPRKG